MPYFGDNTDRSCKSYGCSFDFWRLPAVLAADVITVAWKHTGAAGGPKVCVSGNVDDFDWAKNFCNLSATESGSNLGARTRLTVKAAAPTAYLQFLDPPVCPWACGSVGPYQFTVESIQHAVGVAMDRPKGSGAVTGTAVLSDGQPVPDGVVFTLVMSSGGKNLTRTAPVQAGKLTFNPRYPKNWVDKRAFLTIARPADAGFLAASTTPVGIRIAK